MLKFTLLFISLILLSIPHWIKQTFGLGITTEQVFFHLLGGRTALVGTDFSVYLSFFHGSIITPFCITILLYLALHVINLKSAQKYSGNLLFKTAYSPKSYFAILALSFLYLSQSIHLYKLVQNNYGEDGLTPAFVKPDINSYFKPAHKKNLILIYFESLEYNLQNSKIQGSNLIEAIDDLGGSNLLLAPAPGTGWSIAGMVSSQCSLPLKIFYANDKVTETMFLPGAICIGDILKHQGYTQYFLLGPDLRFAGTDRFYEDHGYDFAYGLNQWKQQGLKPELFSSWGKGIQDDTLFEEAEKIILKNVALKRPYNLSLITTDSHFPNGYASPRCSAKEQSSGFKGAFYCSSHFLANFIKDLKSKHLLDNTVVIIMGDHPFMNTSEQAVDFPNPRNVYFKIIEPTFSKKPTRQMMTHFDVAPTILDALAFSKSENTRFGLGVSIYSNISSSDYSKQFNKAVNENILNRSKTYDSFWVPRANK